MELLFVTVPVNLRLSYSRRNLSPLTTKSLAEHEGAGIRGELEFEVTEGDVAESATWVATEVHRYTTKPTNNATATLIVVQIAARGDVRLAPQ